MLKYLWNGIALVAVAVLIGVGAMTVLFGNNGPQRNVTIEAGPMILEQVRSVNKQIFIEHYGSIDVSETEAPTGWARALERVGISQNYVILVRGRVPAGFDLTQFSEDDIWVSADGRHAKVTLPPPQIFMELVSIDFANMQILSDHDRCPNFLCRSDMEVMKDDLLPAAQDQLIRAAYENQILEQAATNGRIYYQALLQDIGVDEVRVVVEGYSSSP